MGEGLLAGVRVLELSAPSTMLAGRILGDFGADVVTVEPIGGAAGRRLDPFTDGVPGLDRSLVWQALNYNKRGMTLDWRRGDGQAIFGELAARFDIVVEATRPGAPSPFEAIELPDRAIHAVITQFSASGPKASYKSTELVMMAASGAPSMAGRPERPPLFFPTPQAIMEAGAETAAAVLAALAARDGDGLGQRVEVSTRIAAMSACLGRLVVAFSGDSVPTRATMAGSTLSGVVNGKGMYRTSDGFVALMLLFGGTWTEMTRQIAGWAAAEGELAADTAQFQWDRYARAAAEPAPPEPLAELERALDRLCARLTKLEIAAVARRCGFMAAPLMDMKDVSVFEQYRERGLFATSPVLPDGREIEIPARFVRISEEPVEIRRPAPRLSEHTAEILAGELGLSALEIQALFVHEVI